MAIRFFDMFSGIGGFRSGLTAVGDFECVGHCEIDKYANKAYCAMYETRGEYYYEDARSIDPESMPDFELLCAGFPCQAFSIAGKRLGFEDTRGTLFFEVARILAVKRPPFIFLENVPGLLSHDEGRTLKTIFEVLVEMGYNLEWCVLNSKHFGVPQQRKRLYIIGYLDCRCTGEIFPVESFIGETLEEIIPGSQGQRVYSTQGVACSLTANGGGMGAKTGLYLIDMNSDPVITDVARCITARQDSGISNHRGEHSGVLIEESNNEFNTITVQDKHGVFHRGRVRKLMPIECWRLQGFSDEQFNKVAESGIKDGQLYKMAGNSVSVPVISAIGRKIKQVNEKYSIIRRN